MNLDKLISKEKITPGSQQAVCVERRFWSFRRRAVLVAKYKLGIQGHCLDVFLRNPESQDGIIFSCIVLKKPVDALLMITSPENPRKRNDFEPHPLRYPSADERQRTIC